MRSANVFAFGDLTNPQVVGSLRIDFSSKGSGEKPACNQISFFQFFKTSLNIGLTSLLGSSLFILALMTTSLNSIYFQCFEYTFLFSRAHSSLLY